MIQCYYELLRKGSNEFYGQRRIWLHRRDACMQGLCAEKGYTTQKMLCEDVEINRQAGNGRSGRLVPEHLKHAHLAFSSSPSSSYSGWDRPEQRRWNHRSHVPSQQMPSSLSFTTASQPPQYSTFAPVPTTDHIISPQLSHSCLLNKDWWRW